MNARECIRQQLSHHSMVEGYSISSKDMAAMTGKSENVYRRTLASMVRDGELSKLGGAGPSRYVRGPLFGKPAKRTRHGKRPVDMVEVLDEPVASGLMQRVE